MLIAATCLLAQTQLALAKLEPENPKIAPSPTSKVVPAGKTTGKTTDSKSKDTKIPLPSETKETKIKKIDQYARTLQFGKDNTFRIVQFSDIWFDSDDQNYLNTQKLMENIIKKEQPDLIVVSGESVSVKLDKLSTDYEGHLNDAFKAIIDSKTPYVATGGSIIKDVAR